MITKRIKKAIGEMPVQPFDFRKQEEYWKDLADWYRKAFELEWSRCEMWKAECTQAFHDIDMLADGIHDEENTETRIKSIDEDTS